VSQVNEYRQHRFVRPPGATELLLVRHGESEPARAGEPFPMVDGQGDPALHPEGHEQAQRVAERLQVEDIAAIYVTTLRRTVQTATPLAERLGLPPIVEPDLREVHLGEWEGGSFRRHVAEGHPLAVKMRAEQRWDVIPGAEPADRFAARIRDAVERLAGRHRDQCIAAFSHGAAIGQVLALASGSRPFAFAGSDNGAISHIVVAEDRWVVRCYNDTGHLRPAFSTMSEPLT
jgi:probable phosphoglycerate mutase